MLLLLTLHNIINNYYNPHVGCSLCYLIVKVYIYLPWKTIYFYYCQNLTCL